MAGLGMLIGSGIGARVGAAKAAKIGAGIGKAAGRVADSGAGLARTVQGVTQPKVPFAPGKINTGAGRVANFLESNRDSIVGGATTLGTQYAPQIGAIVGAKMLGGRHQSAPSNGRNFNMVTGAYGPATTSYGGYGG